MWVVKYRKIFYIFSGALVALSFISLFVWGLKPGIDFSGGTLIELTYLSGRPNQSVVVSEVSKFDSAASVRPSGTNDYIIRMKPIDQAEKLAVLGALSVQDQSNVSNSNAGSSATPAVVTLGPGISSASNVPVVKSFDSVGPVLGAEALRKSYVSVILVILCIVLYITFAFRKVSEPVQSWKYGLVAIAALVHDVIIPTGVFSILGHFAGYEVDTLFVTALLVILGFSVHDTIVVFDRVRENLKNSSAKKPFAEVVGESVSQTFTRSINTSMTTLIALVVLYFLGGQTTEHFSLALIIGIAVGTYSSIFIGSPLLVTIERWRKKK